MCLKVCVYVCVRGSQAHSENAFVFPGLLPIAGRGGKTALFLVLLKCPSGTLPSFFSLTTFKKKKDLPSPKSASVYLRWDVKHVNTVEAGDKD